MTELPRFVLLLSVLWLLSLAMQPLARRLRIPLPLLLVATGFGLSELLVALAIDTGLRWHSFSDVVIHVLVPLVIFRSALSRNWADVRSAAPIAATLAGPMLLVVVAVATIILYYGIGHATGFPWIAAVYAALLISATDPSPLAPYLQRAKAIKLNQWLQNESLLTDVTVIMLFAVVSSIVISTAAMDTVGLADSVIVFLQALLGALVLGGVLSVVVNVVIVKFNNPHLLLLAIALGTFSLCQQLQVSGVMALLVIGLSVKGYNADRFWQQTASTASATMFLLAGMTITLTMFETRWLAMLWGIGAAFSARLIGLLLFLPLVNMLAGRQTTLFSWKDAAMLHWGGFRGTITLALALSLPVELEAWFTVQSIAYGVVLYGLIVQLLTFPWLHRRLN